MQTIPTLPAFDTLQRRSKPDLGSRSVHFRGEVATRAAKEQFLSADAFERVVREDTDPYVGTLPQSFMGSGLSDKALFQTLDKLAGKIGKVRFLPGMKVKFKLGQAPVTISPVQEQGTHAVNYRMSIGNDDYLFRKYTPSVEDGVNGHGPFGEISSGLFLSNWKFEDNSSFYFGNPVAGWLVDEWIGPDETPTKRRERFPGSRCLSEILTRFELRMDDDKAENRINGIRVDRGGIFPQAEIETFQNVWFRNALNRH